ncbi:MAG TPA: hypothetical protein VIC84_24125 [Blastocatellia bacterium]|jgi:hypothetical protein
MQVQERFLMSGRGLTLIPDFPVSQHFKQDAIEGQVLVITPNGEQKEFQANFQIWHFNFRDPGVDISRRWRIVVSLPSALKEDVPVGSRVLVTPDIKQAIGTANS